MYRLAGIPLLAAALCTFSHSADALQTLEDVYLKASNAEAQDQFGVAIAISGDTLVVGAPGERSLATEINGDESDNGGPSTGAAYVFVRSGSTWIQQAYLKASNAEATDHFGGSVTISGDTIAVGASSENGGVPGVNVDEADNSKSRAGAVYVFVRNGSTWSQQAYVKASNPDVDDFFGEAVALDGDRLLVGADLQ